MSFYHRNSVSLDGLEPPMLDETWGLSNKSWKYEGKYSNYGSKNDQNMAQKLKQKYGKGI